MLASTVLLNAFSYLMQTSLQSGEDAKIVEQIYYFLLDVADSGEFT